jgi:hydroxymethylglutaryl-CoA lyase
LSSPAGHVSIREVGPRDGFQNEPELIDTEEKLALIRMLARTGVPRMEIASFVRGDVIPQLADAAAVLTRAEIPSGVERSVIVPNERGLADALELAGYFDDVNVFLSASESHNERNVNRSIDQSLEALERVLEGVVGAGLRPRASISTAFGCPYEGEVPFRRVAALAQALVGAGAVEIGFGDTTGMANPSQVTTFFTDMRAGLPPEVELTAHFHNTRGQGLANVYAALLAGCRSFDASFGELGGCPVPAGATGNIATEDLVSMVHEMGLETGIDLHALIGASRAVQRTLNRPLTAHTLVAGPIDWHRAAL